mmetsp:Transcript_57169/g.66838  ORF Transcript_57169/g.66838 Transcript_57169/m.66838 type:complete len:583 (-) Transcript_57169:1040-2788(-)
MEALSKRVTEMSSKLDYINEICTKLQQENFRLKNRFSEVERHDSETKADVNEINLKMQTRFERLETAAASSKETRDDDSKNGREEIKNLVTNLRQGVESMRRTEAKERNDRNKEIEEEKRVRQAQLQNFQNTIESKRLKHQRLYQVFVKDMNQRHNELDSRLSEKVISLEAKNKENEDFLEQNRGKMKEVLETQKLETAHIKSENEEVINKMKLLERWVLSKHIAKARQDQQIINKSNTDMHLGRSQHDKSFVSSISTSTTRSKFSEEASTEIGELDKLSVNERSSTSSKSSGVLRVTPDNNIFDSAEDIDLQMIAFALRGGIEIKDRTYHLLKYKECFVGSEVVDFLLLHNLANSRLTGLRIGQVLGTICDMFEHVTGDHEFKDEYLFYRFKKPELRHNIFESSTTTGCIDLDLIAAAMRSGINLHDRVHRFRTYKNVFVASDAIDFLVEERFASTREDAVRIGRCLGTVCSQFHHVLCEHEFKDEHLFFRFQSNMKRAMGRFIYSTHAGYGSVLWQSNFDQNRVTNSKKSAQWENSNTRSNSFDETTVKRENNSTQSSSQTTKERMKFHNIPLPSRSTSA